MKNTILHYTDGGLNNIWLKNGFEVRDTPYGEGVAIHDIDGLTKTICLALINKSSPLTGDEFRYIRNGGMLLSQTDLALMMGVDALTINRWEGDEKVSQVADEMIRALFRNHASSDHSIE